MKMISHFIWGVLLILLAAQNIYSQEKNQHRLAILPFHTNGIDSVSLLTAESILRIEINKLSSMDIISQKKINEIVGSDICNESECALGVGQEVNADQVLMCKLSSLGEKIITQYYLIDITAKKELLVDQMTATTVEELETVMKRIATSITKNESFVASAEVGNIIEQETKEPLRRSSKKNIGLSFGYLFPQRGYDNDFSRSMVFDFRAGYELEEATVGMLLGIRKGFAMNIYGSYLFTKTDICPYVGGAFGFHWVNHDNWLYNEYSQVDSQDDGFEFTLHTGLRILRTYNFQIMINLDYIITLNDYNDRAIVLTIGIL